MAATTRPPAIAYIAGFAGRIFASCTCSRVLRACTPRALSLSTAGCRTRSGTLCTPRRRRNPGSTIRTRIGRACTCAWSRASARPTPVRSSADIWKAGILPGVPRASIMLQVFSSPDWGRAWSNAFQRARQQVSEMLQADVDSMMSRIHAASPQNTTYAGLDEAAAADGTKAAATGKTFDRGALTSDIAKRTRDEHHDDERPAKMPKSAIATSRIVAGTFRAAMGRMLTAASYRPCA